MINEKVVAESMENCLASYNQQIGIDVNTSVCGCCGEKDFHLNCTPVALQELKLLQMDQDTFSNYQNLPESSKAVWTTVNHNGIVYHLHPEAFIPHDRNEDFSQYSICEFCRNSLHNPENPKLPAFSLKNGHDYGRLDAMPVQDLSDIERLAIAKGRIFSQVYTIRKAKSGLMVNEGLTGHVISFPQKLPCVFESEKSLPDFESLKSSVQIIYI